MYSFLHIKTSVTFKVSSIWYNTPIETFFPTAQNSFQTHRFWCGLVLLLFLVSPFPYWQNISLWGLFFLIWGNSKCLLGQDWENIESGGMGIMPFLVKNCWTLSVVWAHALLNHPSWHGQIHWKSLQKNSLKPNAAFHNNTSWYTDTDGFLEHSPSEGSLYYKGLIL